MDITQFELKEIFKALDIKWEGFNHKHIFSENNGRVYYAIAKVEEKYDMDTGKKIQVTILRIETTTAFLVLEIFLLENTMFKFYVNPSLLPFSEKIVTSI